MFSKLNSLVAEVLTGRTNYGLMPVHPDEEALQLHIDVADRIQKGEASAAHDSMLAIMEQAMDEMSAVWAKGVESPS
jgi:DNA-binding FadR family transcriptional regulator